MPTLIDIDPQITRHFSLTELTCRDQTAVPWNLLDNAIKLLTNLQVLRDALGTKIHITSGYRTRSYNKSVDGASASQHIEASAADIVVEGYTPKQVAAKIEQLIKEGKMQEGGIGTYAGWIHYDCRPYRARWNG